MLSKTINQLGCHNIGILFDCLKLDSGEQINLESEEHMRKKDLVAENKKLKDEVEDLKRQLEMAKIQINIKDICLMLKDEREVYHG